jgi:hypothetical protein
MLERAQVWQRLMRRVALPALGAGTWDDPLEAAFALPPAEGCRVPL